MKMNAKKVPEDCDQRRRDKVRISPVQFLCDREIGTRNAKQGVIINDENNDEKQYWFGRLGDETVHNVDFEERFWYKTFGLIKEQCYHSMNSEEKIQYSSRRIKISASGEKCVEVMITNKLVMPYYDRKEKSS